MVDTSEVDNNQVGWDQEYVILRHAYEEKCRDLDRLLFDTKALNWLERVVCGLVGILLSLAVTAATIYGPGAPRETQAEKDLIHALDVYRKATIAENVRHWFKTIGH